MTKFMISSHKVQIMKDYKAVFSAISLFCGARELDLGFENKGFYVNLGK